MSLTLPYKQQHYVGEAAGDAVILNWLRGNLWTHDGTNLGNPIEGMLYYDETAGVKKLKVYASGAWEVVVSGAGLYAAYVAGQTIDVDTADLAISFTGAYSFTVDLAGITPGDVDGFFIEDTDHTEYIRATMNNTGLGIDWSADVRSIIFEAREYSSITVDGADLALITTTTGDIKITAANDTRISSGSRHTVVAPTSTSFNTGTMSIDANNDSRFTVTGSGKDLTLEVVGGGVQQLILNSEGTGADALDINAPYGGIAADAKTIISLDAKESSNFTVTGADQDLILAVVGAGTQQLILNSAGTGINAIDLNATGGGITADALTSISLDAHATSNFSVNGSGEHLTVECFGGGLQKLFLTSVGTGADAIDIKATGDTGVGGGININANLSVTVDAKVASHFIVSGATEDLEFGARGSTIYLNEFGEESLNANFVAMPIVSIVGALNELEERYYKDSVAVVNAAAHTFGADEVVLLVTYSLTGVCTVTIPTAEINIGGRRFVIMDAGLNAEAFNILVVTEGAQTINGQPDATINVNATAIHLHSDGTNLYVT